MNQYAPDIDEVFLERFEPAALERQCAREQRIRELAYYKWMEAGCPINGDGLNFWLQAESEFVAAEKLVNEA